MNKLAIAITLSSMLSLGAVRTAATVIGFDAGPTGVLASYSEDGFTLTPLTGTLVIPDGAGNPAPRLDKSEEFTLAATDGSPFDLFALQSHESLLVSSEWTAEGVLVAGGTVTQLLTFPHQAIDTFADFMFNGFENLTSVTFSPNVSGTGVSWDNIQVTRQSVPEPASIVLILGGLADLMLMRRKAA